VKRLFALAALLAWGCSKDINNSAAIRQAVVDHLATRQGLDLNLASLNVEVTALNMRANDADATVSFVPKSGGGGMTMRYTFEKSGGKWVVKAKKDTGANPHGESTPQGELPAGHPPLPANKQ
jgi:hypothetical protein